MKENAFLKTAYDKHFMVYYTPKKIIKYLKKQRYV